MKFGKLSDIGSVDFTLPPDDPFTRQQLESLPDLSSPAHFYIGCTGWSMKEWVGRVYPRGTKPREFLKQYGRQFNTIELNTTHYRIPDPATVSSWKEQTPGDFRFCPKIPQVISHSRNLGLGGDQLDAFCRVIAGLEEKLGVCFLQLPPYFGYDRLEVLDRFLRAFPREIPLAIEFRHESWFSDPAVRQSTFSLLHQNSTATVITDVAGRRDVLHQALTTDTVLVRFVGNNLHPTDYSRIDEWVERLHDWMPRGLRQVFFFTHEPDNLHAPELSVYLAALIREAGIALVRGPQLLDPPGGRQGTLF